MHFPYDEAAAKHCGHVAGRVNVREEDELVIREIFRHHLAVHISQRYTKKFRLCPGICREIF